MARVQRQEDHGGAGRFLAPSTGLTFVKSGCTLLDLVVGGGWPLGRMVNIVGDKSTGKTLMAIEAAANFAKAFPNGKIWYREAEAAFDKDYAKAMGMPIDRVSFGKNKFDTVEDFYEDLKTMAEWSTAKKVPGLYVLDSLDALSDRKELAREVDKGSYGADKAKQMSALFRKLTRSIEQSNILVVIISQVRDNIGVTFGRKTKRSGGHAMDFYASLVLYLAHIETIKKTKKGQQRAVAVRIKAKCDKNKIGLPYRECEFTIRFGYGIEDLQASLSWLMEIKKLKTAEMTEVQAKKLLLDIDDLDAAEYADWQKRVNAAVRIEWRETEKSFLPRRAKYA